MERFDNNVKRNCHLCKEPQLVGGVVNTRTSTRKRKDKYSTATTAAAQDNQEESKTEPFWKRSSRSAALNKELAQVKHISVFV